MKIYLDSSKVSEAEKWNSIIDGATTNPTILRKDGGNIYQFAQSLAPRPVSVEATGDFVTEARKYASEIPNAVIKVPLLKPDKGDNLSIIKTLSGEGIQINCTALFSLSQVVLATKAGARYVSLFYGRIDDEGGNAYEMVEDCVDFLERYNYPTELIVGSIRGVGHVLNSIRAGAHIVTIPPDVLSKMVDHKFSRDTVRMFERDQESLKVGKLVR